MLNYKNFSDKGVEFEFNEKRAIEICSSLFNQYLNKDSFFARHQPPQIKFFPKYMDNSKLDIAQYFLNLVVLDVGDVSDKLYKRVSTFANAYYEQNGVHFFSPENILKFENHKYLENYMNKKWRVGIGFSKKFKFIMENAELLQELGEELVNLDKLENRDILEQRETLKEFSGININSSLYQRYMIDFGLWSFSNQDELVVKIDTHKIRFPFQFGFYKVDFSGSQEGNLTSWHRGKFEPLFEEMYRDVASVIAYNNGIQTSQVLRGLDEIIWRLRSSYCSQNSMKLCKNYCEFESECNGNPYITTQSSNKIKERKKTNYNLNQMALIDSIFQEETQTQEEKYKPKNLIDRISGKSLSPKPGNIYPFVDIRRDNIPIKIVEDLSENQGNLF